MALEVLPGRVVRQVHLAGAVTGDAYETGVEHQDVPVVLDGDHRVGQRLTVAYDGGQDVGHLGAALHGGGLGGVRHGRLHPGVQLADGREQHARLAERGQDLADVAEEGGVRADDQDGPLG